MTLSQNIVGLQALIRVLLIVLRVFMSSKFSGTGLQHTCSLGGQFLDNL